MWHGLMPETPRTPAKDRGRRVEVPALHMPTLMPLWPMLQKAMDAERISTAVAVAIHTFALSMVRVNGQRRCKRIQIGFKALLQKSLQHVQAAAPLFCAAAPHLTMPIRAEYGGGVCIQQLSILQTWLDMTLNRAKDAPPGSSNRRLVPEEMRRAAARQRDQTLTLNPWIAGQQMPVATLGVHMTILLPMADCLGQTRLVLHLYNALQRAGVMEPLPLLDLIEARLRPGPVLWFSGKPTCNFDKQYLHAMSMVANTSVSADNRALSTLQPADVSSSFRRSAAADYSDVPFEDSDTPLRAVLDAIRASFKDDQMVGLSMLAVGASLLPLMEELCEALGVRGRVESEACELRATAGNGGSSGRRRHGGNLPTDVSIERQALLGVIPEVRRRPCLPLSPARLTSDSDFPRPSARSLPRDLYPAARRVR
jgi:hypothetical protein